MNEEEIGLSRATNASGTSPAPVQHHCERREGGRKDRHRKQTRLGHVPPLQSSANPRFFSLRTYTEAAYFKIRPKNMLSEVS